MVQRVRDVMTAEPVIVPEEATLPQVATVMRDRDIGDVIVGGTDGSVRGLLTDRDLVVRGLTAGDGMASITAGEICTRDVETIDIEESAVAAVDTMRERAIRRLPVSENGQLVGVVSIGDLAVERDPESALGEISAAPPNN